MILSGASHVIRAITSAAAAVDFYVNYADKSGASVDPAPVGIKVATAATTTLLAGSATAGVDRRIKSLTCRNIANSAAQTVELQFFDGTNAHSICRVTLTPGEFFVIGEDGVPRVFDNSGRVKTVTPDRSGITGRSVSYLKVGTVKEAAGIDYLYAKDSGSPGAWSPGTPGLNGRATDGMAAADAGCLPLWTPTGNLYLTGWSGVASVADSLRLIDLMWINTGLAVTTTTAQALTPVAIPARDNKGTSDGEQVRAALLVTTATTNTNPITNTTISYTNQDGTAGRTGTMPSFPATAVAGTLVPFLLAAGDRGVRSVQSVTLGTSYGGGAISLVLFHIVARLGQPAANIEPGPVLIDPGVRLYTGSCLFPLSRASATTATTVEGTILVMER